MRQCSVRPCLTNCSCCCCHCCVLLPLLLQAEVPKLWEDSDPKYITDSSEVCIVCYCSFRLRHNCSASLKNIARAYCYILKELPSAFEEITLPNIPLTE
jgi:hypothetical protein